MDHQPKVMVVDDEEQVATSIVKYFEANGFVARGFSYPHDAPAAVESFSPDLIFVDIIMPQLDGYQFREQIRANPITERIPVVFLTAQQRVGEHLKPAVKEGELYVRKPFRLSDLKTVATLTLERAKNREPRSGGFSPQ